MADVDITYGCGCGFKTVRAEAAVEHSDDKQHTLTVLGTIKPASRTHTTTTQARTESSIDVSRIEELRHKINGGR